MRMTRVRRTPARLTCLAMALALALPPVQAQQSNAPRGRAPVTVNFVNADIEGVTRAFAAMIGRQIAVDPRVKGTITVYSEQPQSVPEAYQGYLSALRGLGFAVVESGGLLKVVPESEAKLQTSTVAIGEAGRKGDMIITQIFTLRHENPNNLVAVLRPLISANNTINASPGNNSLVITDYAENLQRLGKIIAALDQPTASDIEVIPLEHLVASDVAAVVQRLADGSPTAVVPGVTSAGGTTVLADPRTNSLIVRSGNAARLAAVRSVVAKLDRPATGGGVAGAPGMWVVHLKNADATRLATVLRAAFAAMGGSGGSSSGGGGGSSSPLMPGNNQPSNPTVNPTTGATGNASAQSTTPVAASAQPSTGGFIQADPSTNSLIITAPEPLYRQLRAMIDQLDSRRAQVYIESMIVEVAGGDAADFGFEWLGSLGSGSRSLQAVQNLTTGAAPNIVSVNSSLASGSVTLGEGLSVGIMRTIDGVKSLAAILRLLQSRAQTNIVSTPNLITLDNEEAKIVDRPERADRHGPVRATRAPARDADALPDHRAASDVGITLKHASRSSVQGGSDPPAALSGAERRRRCRRPVPPTRAASSTNKRTIEGDRARWTTGRSWCPRRPHRGQATSNDVRSRYRGLGSTCRSSATLFR